MLNRILSDVARLILGGIALVLVLIYTNNGNVDWLVLFLFTALFVSVGSRTGFILSLPTGGKDERSKLQIKFSSKLWGVNFRCSLEGMMALILFLLFLGPMNLPVSANAVLSILFLIVLYGYAYLRGMDVIPIKSAGTKEPTESAITA